MAYLLEGFNGYGYHRKGVPSPYLWGGSNQYVRGKYVADHVFDSMHVDQQMGCLPILKLIQQANKGSTQATPVPVPVPRESEPIPEAEQPPSNQPTLPQVSTSGGIGAMFLGGLYLLWEYWYLVAGAALLTVLGYLGYRVYAQRKAERLATTSPKAE